MVSGPFTHIAYAVEIPLMGLAVGTVMLRVWSRIAVKGRLAVDDGVLLLGTVSVVVPRVTRNRLMDLSGLRHRAHCYLVYQYE